MTAFPYPDERTAAALRPTQTLAKACRAVPPRAPQTRAPGGGGMRTLLRNASVAMAGGRTRAEPKDAGAPLPAARPIFSPPPSFCYLLSPMPLPYSPASPTTYSPMCNPPGAPYLKLDIAAAFT